MDYLSELSTERKGGIRILCNTLGHISTDSTDLTTTTVNFNNIIIEIERNYEI